MADTVFPRRMNKAGIYEDKEIQIVCFPSHTNLSQLEEKRITVSRRRDGVDHFHPPVLEHVPALFEGPIGRKTADSD